MEKASCWKTWKVKMNKYLNQIVIMAVHWAWKSVERAKMKITCVNVLICWSKSERIRWKEQEWNHLLRNAKTLVNVLWKVQHFAQIVSLFASLTKCVKSGKRKRQKC